MENTIINFIHEYYDKNKTTPKLKDFVKKNGYPCNKETLLKIFGTYNSLIERCGYKTYEYGQRHYNEEELLQELKSAILQHRSIDFRYIRKDNNLKHRDIYTRVFGSVRKAIDKLDISNNHIYLLRMYNDYSLEEPISFLKQKLNFVESDISNNLINELTKLTNKNVPLLRDAVKENMSIYKIYTTFGNFNNFVIMSGNQVNLSNKNYIIAEDGHLCDSYEEKIIDDMLNRMNINHDCHIKYPNSRKICDFKLNNCYIECVGYKRNATNKNHDKYIDNIKHKENICKKLGVKLILIEDAAKVTEQHLAEAFKSNLNRIIL